MHWFGIAIALSSALLSTGLGRSHIRSYFPNLNDTLFDVVLIVLIIVGLGLTTIKHYFDQHEIRKLEEGVDLIHYQEVSLYSPTGNKSGKIEGINMVPTPINDWSDKYVHYEDDGSGGRVVFKCIQGAKDACLEVINKMPFYPFSYYFLAQCLKEEGDQLWVEMARKAKSILEKTTRIPGHNSKHDKVLKRVNIMLEDTAKD